MTAITAAIALILGLSLALYQSRRRMSRRHRKLILHVGTSVGWLGAAIAMTVLLVTALYPSGATSARCGRGVAPARYTSSRDRTWSGGSVARCPATTCALTLRAREYGRLKDHLAGRFRADRDAYTDAETDFISEAVRRAMEYKPG